MSVDRKVTAKEAADIIREQKIVAAPGDAGLRSAVVSFSFGPRGLVLRGIENRKDSKS